MTKRGTVSTVWSIFNPLGFLAPFTLKAKLIQSMKLEWDEEIPVELQRVWKRWLQGISEIKGFQIKKRYHQQRWKCSKVWLHVFVMHLKQHMGQLVI